MPSKPNRGWGALFQISDKKSDDAPDYDGHITCPVCESWIKLAGWIKEAKETGRKYLNIKATRKSDAADRAAPAQTQEDGSKHF